MEHYLPQTLNAPKQILKWTYAEVFSAAIPFILLVLLKHSILGLIAGYGGFKIYRVITSKYGEYAIFNLLYWKFPKYIHQRETFPDSHNRHFLG